MIELRDIKNALIILLSSNFLGVHVVSDDIEQIKQIGDKKIFPLMHIAIASFNSNLFDSDTRNDSIFIDISYLEEEKISSDKILSISENLKKLIGKGLEVKDRFLHIDNISMNISDDILHILFNINFNNGCTIENIGQKEAKFGNLKLALK